MTFTDLDLELDLYNGGNDGDEDVIGCPRSDLPALEWHVDVLVLNERQGSEETRLERVRTLLCVAEMWVT